MEENKKVDEKVMPKINTDGNTAEFRSIADIAITTTKECCRMINTIFKTTFADCLGSTMEVRFIDGVGYIAPKLHFVLRDKAFYENIPDGKYAAFIPTDFEGKSGTLLAKLTQYSNASIGAMKKVKMTDEAKSIMTEFMMSKNAGKAGFNWDETFSVKASDNGGIDVELYKLDINKMIRKYFGDKDMNDTIIDPITGAEKHPKFYYQVAAIDAMATSNPMQIPDNWKMSITRIAEKNLNEGADLLGWKKFRDFGANIVTDMAY